MTTDNKKEQTSALENADGAKNIAEEKKGGKISGFIKQFFDIKFWKFILVGIINTLVGEGLKFFFHPVYCIAVLTRKCLNLLDCIFAIHDKHRVDQ